MHLYLAVLKSQTRVFMQIFSVFPAQKDLQRGEPEIQGN